MAADVLDLPAGILADRLATGAARAPDVARSVSARVAADATGAFVWHDPDHLAAEASRLETARKANRGIGRLHGLPVAVSDTIDTAGLPTAQGTSALRDRTPRRDAFVVARLRAEGALLAGKTATTEFGCEGAAPVRNPHDPARSAGGAAAGAAAAVAAGIVPFAVGTQTAGAVIGSAALCGVTGYKPTFGAIPRTGLLRPAPSLDTVGVFARTPHGAALLAETLFGHDPADPATTPAPAPRLSEATARGPAVPPVFAILDLPGGAEADAQTRAAMDELTAALGPQAFAADLPAIFAEAAPQRDRVHLAETAHALRSHAERPDGLSPDLRARVAQGAAIGAADYLAARDWPGVLAAGLSEILRRADAILCPAMPGPAPMAGTTEDHVFCALWSFVGFPAVAVPLFTSEEGLPMGVQVVAGAGDDARCLACAQWLHDWAADQGDPR